MADRIDPYRNFNFVVEIDGIKQAGFTHCSSLHTDNIVLKWGLTDSRELFDWYADVKKGKVRRANVSIVVYDVDGLTERVRWNIFNAPPAKWEGPDFSAK